MIFGLFGGPKPAQTPKQMGYEPSPGMEYLMNYTGKNFFSGEDAEDFGKTVTGAVGSGNMDQATAMAYLNSRIRPDDDYFNSKNYANLLDYKLGPTKSKNMIQDELLSSVYRYGDKNEVNRIFDMADRAGVLNNPNELRNYVSQYLARTPEGISKDMSPYLANRSYMGPIVQDEEGRFKGYDVFLGDEAKYDAADNIMNQTNQFAQNTLARLGAKGGFA
jgi:hypothetical protein